MALESFAHDHSMLSTLDVLITLSNNRIVDDNDGLHEASLNTK